MSKNSKIRKSWEGWESDRTDIHSPAGVARLKAQVKTGLYEFYVGIGESMWMHQIDDPKTEDMRMLSRDTVPEKALMQNGETCWFEYAGQIHCLPVVYEDGVGIYGYQGHWHPMPYGYSDSDPKTHSEAADAIRSLDLDYSNSVIMRNDIFSGSDAAFIESQVDLLVDSILTLNQLVMLSRAPYIIKCSEMQQTDARDFFKAVSSCAPFVMRNSLEDTEMQVVEQTPSEINSTLFDVMSKWENNILKQLGIPMSSGNSQKRAQQSVAEVELVSGDDQVSIRRKEKLWQRQKAYERINKMFGVSFSVVSVIDSMEDDEQAGENDMEEEKNDSVPRQ